MLGLTRSSGTDPEAEMQLTWPDGERSTLATAADDCGRQR